ncbi:MAG: hypothetical protein H0X62_10405 [Bacteroidetes bacterium]|nr:hypothetical protein [Bacteroidota bacterium]
MEGIKTFIDSPNNLNNPYDCLGQRHNYLMSSLIKKCRVMIHLRDTSRTILLLLTLALACSFSTFGQVKVFKTYDDYSNGKFDSYTQIRKADLSNNFIVKDDSNNKKRIPRASIWGYQDEKGNLYRVWNDLPLKVDFSNNRIVIYLSKKDDTILLDDMIIPDTKNILYFSTNLSDEIHKMTLDSLLSDIDFTKQEKEKIIEIEKKTGLKKEFRHKKILFS